MKISYTSLEKYITCPKEFEYHYIHKLRQLKFGSALLFGSAVDAAVTDLLLNKDLNQAIRTFNTSFSTLIDVNGVKHPSISYEHLHYLKGDLDLDLLSEEEKTNAVAGVYPAQWITLVKKGEIILTSFYKHILPKVKRVIAYQDEIELKNNNGDLVTGKCDFVVEWTDGRILAIDLKTSGMMYDDESVKKSVQLAIYYTALKEKYKINQCGYWVCLKNINKNKKKTCSVCSFDGSGSNFHTCNNKTGTKRCNGEWDVTVDPSAYIQILIDDIDARFVDLVTQNLDDVNFAVKNKLFYRNFNSCWRPYGACAYIKKCFENSEEGLVKKN